MIISRTPFRVSFFGGGTDYPAWYLREGGQVVSAAIDKYCFLSCRELPPFFDMKHRIVWSHIETVNSLGEILHPAVREGLRYLGFSDEIGIELHHQGDLPARSGMGSSASFVVGMLQALTALRGKTLERREIALRAIELEQRVLHENVGSQDPIAAAYGGLNHIRFRQDGEIEVEPVGLARERLAQLESSLVLLYTGRGRLSSEVSRTILDNLDNRKSELRRLGSMVGEALAILTGTGDLEPFGELLHESWLLKRSLSDAVSNASIDAIYDRAREHGAVGGKLLGAGASGFMLFFVPPPRREAFERAFEGHVRVPVRVDHEGSVILHRPAPGAPR